MLAIYLCAVSPVLYLPAASLEVSLLPQCIREDGERHERAKGIWRIDVAMRCCEGRSWYLCRSGRTRTWARWERGQGRIANEPLCHFLNDTFETLHFQLDIPVIPLLSQVAAMQRDDLVCAFQQSLRTNPILHKL